MLGWLRPIDVVGVEKHAEVYERLHLLPPEKKLKAYKFNIGDKIRISTEKVGFEKEGNPNKYSFTEEVFTVHKRFRRDGINLYKISDCNKEVIEAAFYEQEMQKITQDKFKVDEVIDHKIEGGVKWALVHFRGFPKSCQEWVKEKDVVKI